MTARWLCLGLVLAQVAWSQPASVPDTSAARGVWGAEVNPFSVLLWPTIFNLSVGGSYFGIPSTEVNLTGFHATQTIATFLSDFPPTVTCVDLNLRVYLDPSRSSPYLGFFTRSTWLGDAHASVQKQGAGVTLGGRMFRRGHIYYGFHISLGRYFSGRNDKIDAGGGVQNLFFIWANDSEQIFDVQLGRIGWMF